MSLPHPILAIDHGEARIGIAASDPLGIIAHPIETVPNNDNTLERINTIIEQKNIASIVIGLPLRMDGSEGTATIKIRKFVKLLKGNLVNKLPLEFVDERMTTIAAADKLRAAGKKAKQQKEIIDQAAAVEILSNYMQSQSNPFGLLEEPLE